MATKKETVENEEIKEEKKTSKRGKTTAEGTAKKTTSKRSTSASASKTVTSKKATTKKTTTKKDSDENKTKEPEKATKKTTSRTTTKRKEPVEKKNEQNVEEVKLESEKPKRKASSTKKVNDDETEKRTTTKKADTKEKSEEALEKMPIEEIEKTVKKEIKDNKKVSQAEENKMLKNVFQNISLATIIMFYFNFIILGFINIEKSVFLTDIKVFSLGILVIAICTFEYAYRKESGKHAIHGIEALILAVVTMSLLYINLMWLDKFIPVTVLIAYAFAIYYIIKSIVIYVKFKKQYSASSMKEIIKK